MNKNRKIAKKKKQQKKSSRFTAMSKLIGFGVFGLGLIVVVYSMYEMHITSNLEALPTLITGVLAIITSYIGFYINMSKAEHIEDKKNQIKKELELIRRDGITEEERQRELELEENLELLNTKLEDLNTEETINYQ